MNIGYIGLGLMGEPMARRLLSAGYSVRIWGRTPAKLEGLYAAGAERAESPSSLASNCDIVFLCVTDTAAVEEVVFGSDGIVRGARDATVLVDMSSIEPGQTVTMARDLKERTGMNWIDAPVSGGVPGAEGGTLAIMCGGDEDVFERTKPVLELLGRPTRMGDVGAGQGTKLVNQLIVACGLVVVAEATHLAERAGIDVSRIPVALAGGRADSPIMQQYMLRMAENDTRVEGTIATIRKDMKMIEERAADISANLPMLAQATAIHDAVIADGHAQSDNAAVYDFYRNSEQSDND